MKIVVTVPTYNEIENIEALVAEILAQDGRIEVLVADDDSPDGTWRAVAAMAERDPRVHLLHRTTDRGRGAAGRAAFVWALDRGADVVFEMDADFSHAPRFLPALIAALDDCDVVLGSRRVAGGEDVGRTRFRLWLTAASNVFVQLVLGLRVKDCNSGYRGWRASALEAADVRHAFSPGPAIVHELLFKAHRRGQRIREVPIVFRDREEGESTLTFRTLLRSYVTVLRLRWLALTGRLFAALLCAVLVAGCGDGAPPAPEPVAPPNVLLITLDTLRADHVGALAPRDRDVTPRLDALAQRSAVFTHAFANSSFTPPSHASILTGRFPSEHGLMHWSQKLLDVPTAAERFAAAGYRTLAVTPLPTLFKLGLDRGFDTTLTPPHTQADGLLHLADAERINADVLPLLLADDPRPYFAWLHYYDAHRVFGRQGPEWAGRYDAEHDQTVGGTEAWYQLRPEAGRGKLAQDALTANDRVFMADRYDGGLAYLDAQLGALFDALAADPRWADTVVLVTADHGEVFDEYAEEWYSHDPYLFEENVRVPLILRLPHERAAGTRVDQLVQGVDVLPTLLELAGLPLDDGALPGLSLLPTLEGRELRRPAVFADRMGRDDTAREGVDLAEARATRDRKRMLRTATHKLIHYVDQDRFELFRVDDERRDLFGEDPELDARLVDFYRATLGGLANTGAHAASGLDAAEQAALCALGYGGCPEGGDG